MTGAARTSTSVEPDFDTRTPVLARGAIERPSRRSSVTASRLSSLRSAFDSEPLSRCSAAI